MKLSVIIVSYNTRYFLEQCLYSLKAASQGIDLEIFVVDNASVDGSANMVREKFPGVTCIVNPDNKGFAKANNQAILVSSAEYILLLNPDTVLEKDTLSKCLGFMDIHPEAGAVGVKMLDGKGRFLPESKRGLPTPLVAFYRLAGFSRLFPKSKVFNRYNLGYLAEDEIHEVDVIAGAFMLLRRKSLLEIGLLDEDFFMYGEDIDLSFRLLQAGYKNYYFPEVRIIHFKGESTRKESIDYTSLFYRAMLVFVRKHFTAWQRRLSAIFIYLAILFIASFKLAKKAILVLFPAALDALFILAGFRITSYFWETKVIYPEGGHFPSLFYNIMQPAFCLVIVISMMLSGGYKQPVSFKKVYRGILYGGIISLTAYSLLPETLRFSRAVIILGMLWALISLPFYRYLLSLAGVSWFVMLNEKNKRFLVAGKPDEADRVSQILRHSAAPGAHIRYIAVEELPVDAEMYIGQLKDIVPLVKIHQADEIIFCARDVSTQLMINTMLSLEGSRVSFKIAAPGSAFIIGSNSANERGEIYKIDVHKI